VLENRPNGIPRRVDGEMLRMSRGSLDLS